MWGTEDFSDEFVVDKTYVLFQIASKKILFFLADSRER